MKGVSVSSISESSLEFKAQEAPIDFVTLPWLIRITDIASIIGICSLSFAGAGTGASQMPLLSSLMLGTVIALMFSGLNQLRDGYSFDVLTTFTLRVRSISVNWAATWVFLSFTAFALKATSEFSRLSTVAAIAVAPLVIYGSRTLVSRWFFKAVSAGRITHDRIAMLQVGPGVEISADVFSNFAIVHSEVITPNDRETLDKDLSAFIREAVRSKARKIFVQLPAAQLSLIDQLTDYLRRVPIPSLIVTDEWLTRAFQRPTALHGELTGFELHAPPLTLLQRMQKRALDLITSGLGLIFLAPLLALIAIAVKLDSPGPVLFRQRRKGFNGREFQIYKFRSMSVMEDGNQIRQAKKDDSRVTRVGRFIRATSLDELPQLLNVFRGDMSLIGPRPHAIAHDNHYDKLIGDYSLRRHMKPGLTGWAQIHGHRGETPTTAHMSARVEHDLWYIANWSIWLDLWIMLRTARELLSNRNVY